MMEGFDDYSSELEQIFNTVPDGMAVIDRNFRVLRINPAYLKLLGKKASEVIGQKCYTVLRGSLCHTSQCPLSAILSGQEAVIKKEVEKSLDGGRVPFWLTATPFRSPRGELIGMIQDLRNIEKLKSSELRLKESLSRYKKSVDGTVEAMAAVVEFRDPYTAGHQHRVAQIAARIARKMGLSEKQTHGVWVAGTVHDIGKIAVPSEFLTKPGRLLEEEFRIIQRHPQVGYSVLEKIPFPWPVADTVLQHHERLDGSGYPFGLAGDAIRLEARIIAVADVAEAISSHRPYRPALGSKRAIKEIARNRGVLYDKTVADICLLLFKEGWLNIKPS